MLFSNTTIPALVDSQAEDGETPSAAETPLPSSPQPEKIAGQSINGGSRDPKPTLNQSWERLVSESLKYDDTLIKNWKEDIDTLLVFAGLFSAVVTAFAIESYQWLSEDPADTTVALLIQISLQLNASLSPIPERPPFEADSSAIRINCFWFLSLIVSLTSALFGLLCKQWLREHQRDPPTRTPGETLALRQLRRESFKEWGVPSFLSALPILLEVALLLFFAGVLDLLWNRNPIPFGFCFIAVMLSAGIYFVTTLLPTFILPRKQWENISNADFHDLTYNFICPYKSPQAWAVYHLSRKIVRPFLRFRAARDFILHRMERLYYHTVYPASDWSALDLQVVRQFDGHPFPFTDSNPCNLKVYELRAFQGAFKTFRDSPSMVPHLQNVLKTLAPSVIMSGIFGQWKYLMWEEATVSEVQLRLQNPATFFRSRMERLRRHFGIWWAPMPDLRQPALHHREGIALLFYDQYWTAMAHKADLRAHWSTFFDSIKNAYPHLQRTTSLRFVIPFPILEALWVHDDPQIRSKSLHLLRFLADSWRPHPSPGYDETQHDQERIAFVSALTRHLNRTDHTSVLMTSRRGQQFMQFVNLQIIHRGFYSTQLSRRSQASFRDRSILMLEWARATRRVQEARNLPLDYFIPIPAPQDGPPASLEGANDPAMRYSVDTATPEAGSIISDRLAEEESSRADGYSSTPRGGNLGLVIADGSVTQGEFSIV